MGRTVADQFAEILAAAGVKRIYGIVGDSLNGLTDALRGLGKIEWVHVRHEEVAAFAAGAKAHLTGGLAVCAGSEGPGNLHLINGLFDCHGSSVPVLAILAHIPSAEIGSDYFQKTHPEQLFQECSHDCELVSAAHQMPRTLEVAIREAVGNLLHDVKLLETLRDLSDTSEAVIILSGEDFVLKRLTSRYPQIRSRITETVEFRPASVADVRQVCDELCEIKVADDLVAEIHRPSRGFQREIKNAAATVERFGKSQGLTTIDLAAVAGKQLCQDRDDARLRQRAGV
jgi:hypothetical protein